MICTQEETAHTPRTGELAYRERIVSARRRLTALAICGLMLSAACATPIHDATPVAEIDQTILLEEMPYTIQPGDELEVRFFYTPELDMQMMVRPDGTISAPFAQSVAAAGKTPESLSRELRARFEAELFEPEITVIVRSFGGRKVHVGGEVRRPGVLPLAGPMTLLDALFQSGGILDSANLEQVIVLRKDEGNTQALIVADMRDVLSGRDVTQNIPLRPFDTIFVPKSRIANVNVWVDQYLRQNIPISVSVRPDLTSD